MAYSPVGQGGRLLRHPALRAVAERRGAHAGAGGARLDAAAGRRHRIPKAADPEHVRQNAARWRR